MGPMAGLDGRKISPPPGFDPGRPARSQSLYRLRYPARTQWKIILINIRRKLLNWPVLGSVHFILFIKVKVKVILEQASMAQGGVEVYIALLVL